MQNTKSILAKWRTLFDKNWLNNLLFWGAILALPLIWAYTPDYFRADEIPSFWEYMWLRRKLMVLSYVVLLAVFLALTLIVRKIAVSSLLMSAVVVCGGIANYYKILYRKSPVVPLDLLQIKDAVTVVKEDIEIHLTGEMIAVIALFLLAAAVLFFVKVPKFLRIREGKGKEGLLFNVLLILGCVAFCFFFVRNCVQDEQFVSRRGFRNLENLTTNSYFNTFFTNFLYMTKYISAEPPEGYSPAEMEEIADEIQSIQVDRVHKPDVILIVAESWHMLDTCGASFSQDPFENYKQLAQEGVSGLVFSPYYCGRTANVEFELLTGLPTINGALGETVFNASIYPGFPSLPNYYKLDGYTTIAMHAHTSSLYNRLNAYKDLGFDSVYFSDSFVDPVRKGPYISDQSCIEKAIELYEEAQTADAPVFLHVLTMEGHLMYDNDRLENENHIISAQGGGYSQEELEILTVAATAYGNMDRALAQMVGYLRECPRDVVLIVLGDHQTSLWYSESEGVDFDADQLPLEETRTTPYLVWTNFEAELPETLGTLPPNMLLPKALSALDMNRPVYFEYLIESMPHLNGIDSGYYIGTDGRLCGELTEAQTAEVLEREFVRYDIVNGKHYLNEYCYN